VRTAEEIKIAVREKLWGLAEKTACANKAKAAEAWNKILEGIESGEDRDAPALPVEAVAVLAECSWHDVVTALEQFKNFDEKEHWTAKAEARRCWKEACARQALRELFVAEARAWIEARGMEEGGEAEVFLKYGGSAWKDAAQKGRDNVLQEEIHNAMLAMQKKMEEEMAALAQETSAAKHAAAGAHAEAARSRMEATRGAEAAERTEEQVEGIGVRLHQWWNSFLGLRDWPGKSEKKKRMDYSPMWPMVDKLLAEGKTLKAACSETLTCFGYKNATETMLANFTHAYYQR
jgi:hypothetical protein